VNRPEPGSGRGDRRPCFSLIAYVAAQRQRLGTARGGALFGAGEIDIKASDLGARNGEGKADSLADAAAGSGDDRDLTGENNRSSARSHLCRGATEISLLDALVFSQHLA
jgi:hypothetical protein